MQMSGCGYMLMTQAMGWSSLMRSNWEAVNGLVCITCCTRAWHVGMPNPSATALQVTPRLSRGDTGQVTNTSSRDQPSPAMFLTTTQHPG